LPVNSMLSGFGTINIRDKAGYGIDQRPFPRPNGSSWRYQGVPSSVESEGITLRGAGRSDNQGMPEPAISEAWRGLLGLAPDDAFLIHEVVDDFDAVTQLELRLF
jgi:hypothetical protein